jgi:hypothetical protein
MFILQSIEQKFLKHLTYDLKDKYPVSLYSPNKLYDTIYANIDQITKIIFSSSMINREVIDFIQNSDRSIKDKILFYIDGNNIQLISDLLELNIKILINADSDIPKSKKATKIIKLYSYYSEYLVNNIPDKTLYDGLDIIADISGISNIPEELENICAPNTNLNIKLFNNPNINHIQNLGMVDDVRFVSMIRSSKLYIDLNNYYIAYAAYFKTPLISMVTNNMVKKQKINESSIDSIKNNPISINPEIM